MECRQCQTENPENNKFCRQCGTRLVIVCLQCGSGCSPEDKFCGKCGHELRKPKEASAIDYEQPRSYTPKFLVEKILTSRSAIEGERKLVTVLFADVAGFTPMSEKLDPEDVHEIMDGCFRILMDEIHRYEGTVNEFRGDGVMALFGAPIAHEDHAQRACYASLAIQKALISYAAKLHHEYGVDFKMRIGLNSGPVVVGAIGDDLRMDYTALGDTANLAARMETNAQPGSVLLSEHTYRLTKEFFEFEPLGQIQVKGKEKPVNAYQLTKPSEVETRIAASAAKGLTRFVGRGREIEMLKDAFEQALSGDGQVVGVVGEAGVGKSRLLLELRNSLPKGEYIYLEGRCLHYGSSMPYLPILDALRSYLGVKEGEKESVIRQKMREKIVGTDENLTRCLPPIQELFSVNVDDEDFLGLEPKEKREKTFEALRDILIRGSESRPIVLAVEDLHWIDKTTEEFLDYMIGWLPRTHILLILIYRPEYNHQWGSKSYYSKIGVGQLSTHTSAELVQAILEGGAVVPELRELILSRAAGNPLFMEELAHSLLENGSVQKDGDQYVLARNVSDIQVPDTIQGIIAARMDRLEESLKRIMQIASVIGREFAFRILQAIAEMKENLKSSLLNLQGLEFIYEKSLFPELEYIFRHVLTQEVAYNSLLLKRRKEIHEKIGKAMEQIYPDRLEEFYEMLAYHYSKSDNTEKAFQYLRMSGKKATQNHSMWEAFSYYREAIDTGKQLPEDIETKSKLLEVLHLATTPITLLGYPEGSIHILQDGENLSLQLGDQKSLVTFRSRMGHYHFVRGNTMEGIKYCEQGYRESEKLQDVELMVATGNELCGSYFMAGQHLRVSEVAPKVLDILEQTQRERECFGRPFNVYVDVHGYYGMSMASIGNFEGARELVKKGLSFAQKIKHLPSLSYIEMCCGYVYFLLGDGRSVEEHARRSLAFSEEGQVLITLGLAWTGLGIAHYLRGDHERAQDCITEGLRLKEEVGMRFYLSRDHHALGMVHLDRGDLEKANFHAEGALNLSIENEERENEGLSRILLGRIIGKKEKSRSDEAQQFIAEGITILEELKLRPLYAMGYFSLGEFHADRGGTKKGLEALKKAESMFQEMGMDYWLAKTQEVLARLKRISHHGPACTRS